MTAGCLLLCLCVGAVFTYVGACTRVCGTQCGGQSSISADLFLNYSSPDLRKCFLIENYMLTFNIC